MRIALISVVALLGFLFQQMLLADVEAAEFTMTPRAQKIYDQAPKTPEKFLLVIKSFLKNQTMSGDDFIEKLIGIDRDNWGPGYTDKGYWYDPEAEAVTYRYNISSDQKSENRFLVPFKRNGFLIDKKHRFLVRLTLIETMDSFRLTPSDIRAVFGVPQKIYATNPRDEFSVGVIHVDYYYNFGTYKLSVSTEDTLQYFRKMKHLQGKKISPRQYMKKYENHANYRIVNLTITLN